MNLRRLFAIALLACLHGCSDADDTEDNGSNEPFCGPADTCPPDTTGVDLMAPVSFRADVFEPVFQTSCNAQVCHGHQTLARAGLWLGPASDDAPEALLDDVIAALLEPSATAPEMKNVEPGDPGRSFLMLKVDGCQDAAGLTCEAQEGALCDSACGDGMPPFNSPATDEVFPLAAEQRHAIRAWIVQGAQNN